MIELFGNISGYVYDVFVLKFDAWAWIGLSAQIMFTGRFLVQWFASERAGRSVIPLAFWILSIAGGLLLLIYAITRRDPVFILGQSLGLVIYIRNIVLVLRERRSTTG